MHLILLNISDLLLSLWRGMIAGDKDDHKLWHLAVLKDDVWEWHGLNVASMTPYLPGSFNRPPCNPAKKINSGYKAWEYLMYIFGLGPGLFYNVLPKEYWKNFCWLVYGICILHQFKIPAKLLKKAHQSLLNFILEFEQLYYQQQANCLHFIWPCIHLLIHIAPEVVHAGPGAIALQWTMEHAIGDLGSKIHQPSNPYANLSQCAVLCCQVNALTAILPELVKQNSLPRGAIDLQGVYILLRARKNKCSLMTEAACILL